MLSETNSIKDVKSYLNSYDFYGYEDDRAFKKDIQKAKDWFLKEKSTIII